MEKTTTLHLEYGINLHADHVYDTYEPLQVTSAYPDPFSTVTRQVLSDYTGVDSEMIVCGNGSDELIDIYLRFNKLADDQLNVVVIPPMYYQYPVYASHIGANVISLPHDRTQLSSKVLKEYGAEPAHTVVMLDNPSNPAGDVVAREQIIEILEAGYKVFADEAYFEFYGKTVSDLIPVYPRHLVVSRTLSKFCAMAGSRFGYVLADPHLIKEFNRHRPFFNVNSEAQARTLFALKKINDFHSSIAAIKKSHQTTADAVNKLGYETFASLDLFVIFKHKTMPSNDLHKILREKYQIETHLFDNFKGHSVIRVASARQPDMDRLLDALKLLA
ncbi:MAG TPA: histidinol-phosphate transaminase [Candidatus Saccharimonadales bacterium]|nr:histidinol-phosphate transaminase [Candidatus Saccharimonadales bacterium]